MQSILIVDDIAENLYFLEVLLKGNGFDVRSAQNGAEALDAARRDPPALIVSDILMPVMDGYCLCREWRADERLKAIPFIFYTATFTEKKDEELALSLGAERFVIKPQEPDILMGIIRQVLAGNALPVADLPRDEGELLREYNEALFRKLEKKMADLERVNQELTATIEEQKRLEEQLRQAQKMEAIGRFSAGIAHDFNNILTVIIGFGEMMRMKMNDDDPQRNRVEQILAAASRANNLTRSLLTFSRKQEVKLQPLNLQQIIKDVEVFLHRIIGSDIKLITSYGEEEIMISADAGHIEQVLMNLATNARDAMPDGGMLSIGTEIITIDDEFIRQHGYGTVGRHGVIAVADTGIGMDAQTRQRIFEPFFTTKDVGTGTGLGLAISYGIIHQHHGHISVYSEPGHGTTFRIVLPLMEREAAGADADYGDPAAQSGQETILVVDDDEAIRTYLEGYLSQLGYMVLVAQDGDEAVAMFSEQSHAVDLVLMDIILPRKSGVETASEIRRVKSDIKIVFTSGYPADHIRERNLLESNARILLKPLLPKDLVRALRTMLDEKDGE